MKGKCLKKIDFESLHEILQSHRDWVLGRETGKKADLSYTDLRKVVLRGVSLQGADLTGADFTGADLSYSNIQEAIVKDASFNGACLLCVIALGVVFDGTDVRNVGAHGMQVTDNYMPKAIKGDDSEKMTLQMQKTLDMGVSTEKDPFPPA